LTELIKSQREKINLPTAEQCRVMVDYLEITLKVPEGIEKAYQDDETTLNFWKENYRRALAKERTLNE
jgi:hypothetical protein